MGRLRHEAGQTVVLVAVLLPLFLGLGALAVDIGYWYVVKKTAQDAADAAALAAAAELPHDPELAILTGEDYVRRNMPDATAIAATPYPEPDVVAGIPTGGSTLDPLKIVVFVSHDAPTFFGRMFGVFDATVTARAVAERLPGEDDNLAIFSDFRADCSDGLRFDAADVRINGHIHSNGRFRIDSGPFWAANGTFDVTSGCPASRDAMAQTQFGDDPSATLPLEDVERDWPTWYTPSQLGWRSGCTYDASSIVITSTSITLTEPDQVISHDGAIPDGTYCASETFRIDGHDLHGRLTALSPSITVEGGGLDLRPFSHGVLFFALPNTDASPNDGSRNEDPVCTPSEGAELTLNGSGHRWRGVVFNPCGRIVVNLGDGLDSGPSLEGAILGNRVSVVGDGFEMIGRGDFEYSAALVE